MRLKKEDNTTVKGIYIPLSVMIHFIKRVLHRYLIVAWKQLSRTKGTRKQFIIEYNDTVTSVELLTSNIRNV